MPPEYVLSPISTHLPAFIGNNKEEKKAAKETWWKENETMQEALEQSALKVFDEQKARSFIMSGKCFNPFPHTKSAVEIVFLMMKITESLKLVNTKWKLKQLKGPTSILISYIFDSIIFQ